MKILIVNGYVRKNKGDAALMSVLAKQLHETFPKAFIAIAGMEDPISYPEFEGFKNVGSMRLYASKEDIPAIQRILRKMIVSSIGALWPSLPLQSKFIGLLPLGIREELSAIQDSDLVVSLGGGYLNAPDSLAGNMNIYYLSLPLRLAERLGKPVIMAPESFGPLGNDWQRDLVRKTLNASQLICIREDKSYKLLKDIGVKENLMIRTIDSGFGHTTYKTEKTKDPKGKIRVGITARNWLKRKAQQQYEYALADLSVELEKKYSAEVILVPQVTSDYQKDDDRIVETRIKERAIEKGGHPTQITDEIDHDDIVKLYSTLDFTVGTRFHSVIFSLISYVPAIAIEYEHKTSGIMHDLGLDEWTIKIEDVNTENLQNMFSQLIAKQDAYRKHLSTIIPPYVKKANEAPILMKQAYYQYVGHYSQG